MTRLALLLILATGPAWADQSCADRADLMRVLADKYGETVVSSGIANDGTLMEMTAMRDGTWTLLQTMPDGVSCIIIAGQNFATVAMPPPGELN